MAYVIKRCHNNGIVAPHHIDVNVVINLGTMHLLNHYSIDHTACVAFSLHETIRVFLGKNRVIKFNSMWQVL